MPSNLIAAGLWGGLLALERRAFLQAMVSRPLVAATGMGLFLGDLDSGLQVGLVFELLFLGSASLGGAHPFHDTLASCAGAAFSSCLAGASSGPSTPEHWSLAVLLATPLGVLGQLLETSFDARAVRYLGKARGSLDDENFRRIARQNLWGMWPVFVSFGMLCAAFGALGELVLRWVNHFPLPLARGLAWAFPAMVFASAGVAIRGSHAVHAQGFAALGGALALALFLLRGHA
jgi:PTS system mannose-specific IIC component